MSKGSVIGIKLMVIKNFGQLHMGLIHKFIETAKVGVEEATNELVKSSNKSFVINV